MKFLKWFAILAVAIALSGIGFLALVEMVFGVNDSGSLSLAEAWSRELGQYSTPEVAVANDPTIEHVEFDDGDWIIGRSQDSHGLWRFGGGTLVVKDSKGEIRTFFGHVCGPRVLIYQYRNEPTLEAFYDCILDQNGFKEQKVGHVSLSKQ